MPRFKKHLSDRDMPVGHFFDPPSYIGKMNYLLCNINVISICQSLSVTANGITKVLSTRYFL
jgi:hypothetical protein